MSPNLPGAHPGDHEARAFFDAVLAAFHLAAAGSGGPVDRCYRIAESVVTVSFAGPALVPSITPALEHLAATESTSSNLTLCVFDSASTGVELPPPSWRPGTYHYSEMRSGRDEGNLVTLFLHWLPALALLDTARNLAVLWVPSADGYVFDDLPFTIILDAWLGARGIQMVHAGAVGSSSGGVLLVGSSGAGKSTTALACLRAGLHFLADDRCLVSSGPHPRAYSMHGIARVHPETLLLLPDPTRWNQQSTVGDKRLLMLEGSEPGRLISELPIRAVLVLQKIADGESRIEPTSRGAALRALAPGTLSFLPGLGDRALRQMGRLVRHVPCYNLLLGSDIARVPGCIAHLLSESGSADDLPEPPSEVP